MSTRSARFIGFLFIFSISVLAADDEAGLRPAEQLVARESDKVGAFGDGLGDSRLMRKTEARQIDEGAGAKIVDKRHLVLVRQCREFACAPPPW